MRSVDTNVVVRLLVEDDAEQTRLAEEAWKDLLASGGVFLSKVVLVEVGWSLACRTGSIARPLREPFVVSRTWPGSSSSKRPQSAGRSIDTSADPPTSPTTSSSSPRARQALCRC